MYPFGIMDRLFPFFFITIFSIITITFIVAIVGGIKQWNSNNKQPILDVKSKIVSKHTSTSTSTHNNDGHHHHHTSTSHYVTFEVESGDRIEFHVSSGEYGLLAEGDVGKLTFQGTRYNKFEREKQI